jgi:hypothetical protein
MPGISLQTARLVRRQGCVEIVGGSGAIAARGLWRLGAAFVGGAIAGLGSVFATVWWMQAIAALFGLAGVIFLVRFLVTTVFAPLVAQMSKISVLIVGVPRVEIGMVSIPFHEIQAIELAPASQSVTIRRRDGRVTTLPEILLNEPRANVEALVDWLRQVVMAADPAQRARLLMMV